MLMAEMAGGVALSRPTGFFLTKNAWKTVGKKIELSRKAWKEQEKSGQG